jgi:hypothetical protein
MGYGDYRLHYVRTLDKQELDFVISLNNRPIIAIEVKTGETAVAKILKDREKWFPKSSTLGVQIVDKRGVMEKHPDNTWVVSAERLLAIVP